MGFDVVAEVEEVHRIIQDWMAGDVPEDDKAFKRLESALASDFTLVNPNGNELDRKTLLGQLRQAWGNRAGIRVWAEQINVVCAKPPIVVARYDEYEQDHGAPAQRVSTVVFRCIDGQPNGLEWLRVHETHVV